MLVVLVALVGLLFATASPAAAQDEPTVGAGAGTGFGYSPDPDVLCSNTGIPPVDAPFGAEYDEQEWRLNFPVSTFESVDVTTALTIAAYLGEVTMTIEVGPNVQAPQGAAADGCQFLLGQPIPIVPGPVEITSAEVEGSTGDGKVECDSFTPSATEVYTRVAVEVVYTFTLLCDIEGNVSPLLGEVTDVPVRFVVEGTEVACFPLPEPCTTGGDANADTYLVAAFEAVGPSPV